MNLATKRKQKELSQSQLAALSNVNVRMIEGYERGVKMINRAAGETLFKISKVLNCKIEDLLEVELIEKLPHEIEELNKNNDIEVGMITNITKKLINDYIDNYNDYILNNDTNIKWADLSALENCIFFNLLTDLGYKIENGLYIKI